MALLQFLILEVLLGNVFLVISAGWTNILMLRVKKDSFFNNKIPTTSPLQSKTMRSNLKCIANCFQRKECRMVFYNYLDNICNQYSISKTTVLISNQYENGWHCYPRIVDEAYCKLYDGYIYNSIMGRCVKVFSPNRTHNDAELACLGDGASLARIDTQYMWQFVKTVLADASIRNAYIQAEKDMDGEWYFDDKTPITYYNWGNHQPNNNERFLVLWQDEGYRYHDVSGSKPYGYVCEIYI